MLQINELSHSYGDHTVLRTMDLRVGEGELVSIVGPSGCGKSTLLRCIAGLIRPTSGEVLLNGTPIDGVPDDLAVVFQDYSRSLLPWLTVRDNVALPLRRRGGSRAERRSAAEGALKEVGLADAGRKYPWQLSGGMQQRVSIARALAYRPSLLLMDEPFGSVDAQTREDLEDLVLQVHQAEGMTILLVTHDIDESVYVGDRVVVLGRNPGRIRAELPIELPTPREQITTRSDPGFVRLRAEVGRLVRGAAASGDPDDSDAEPPGTKTVSATTPDDATPDDTTPDDATPDEGTPDDATSPGGTADGAGAGVEGAVSGARGGKG
ncbi:ABC transporter ATP-binding protein [Spirillospora sp. NBC_01491]|uniref:ABC transporter ATP-binding protein n=1 Tax=Spirillospora sp. NBC_01491 TaxID=2976007 RepID=UPI002E2FBD96|nr:ABC transporter ATP-binding protein [Spirillospora sp. NBC_01491]